MTANTNATASMNALDHAATVRRERGSESPLPVSPARSALTGRTAASARLCAAVSPTPAPAAAPTIPYCTTSDHVAPAIAPTTPPDRLAHTAWNATVRTIAPRVQAYVAS